MKRLFDKKFWLWQIVIVLLGCVLPLLYMWNEYSLFTWRTRWGILPIVLMGLVMALLIVITNILGVVIGYKYITDERVRKVLRWLGLLWSIYTMIMLFLWFFVCDFFLD